MHLTMFLVQSKWRGTDSVSSRTDTLKGGHRTGFSLPLDGGVQGVSVVFRPCLPRFLDFEPVYNPCTTCVRDWVHRCKVHGYIEEAGGKAKG
jgi:hypothetical protein